MTKYNEAQVDFRERSKGRIQRQLEISACPPPRPWQMWAGPPPGDPAPFGEMGGAKHKRPPTLFGNVGGTRH